MFRNYFTIIYRSLLKNKILSTANIVNLAIGIAACLLIFLYVAYENSYDEFHHNARDIYRVNLALYQEGKLSMNMPCTPCPLGPAMKKNFPGVKESVRIIKTGMRILKSKKASLMVGQAFAVDSSFLTMFSFPLIKGDAATALSQPFTVVISESFKKKFFADQDPMDKTIIYKSFEGDIPFMIKGVFKDIPKNSHLQFNVLFSIHDIDNKNWWKNNWTGNFDFRLYVLLNPKTKPARLESNLNAFYNNYLDKNTRGIFSLQPLRDIHLYSGHLLWEENRGSYKSVYFFSILALFVVIIAWVNYINITTSRSISRAQEVGIRKVAGATRKQLVQRFLLESLLLNLCGAITALILIQISLPGLNQFFGLNLSTSILYNAKVGIPLMALLFFGSLLSGIYPAVIISSYKPVSILTGKLKSSTGGKVLRKGLVVFQIAVSVFLTASALTVYKQIDYMNKQDLGINIDQVLLVLNPTYGRVRDHVVLMGNVFVEELKKYPVIKNVTFSNYPGEPYFTYVYLKKPNSSLHYNFKFGIIDYNFIDTYEAKLAAGRNFSKEFPTDRAGILLNEKAVDTLGFKNPATAVNQVIGGYKTKYKIIGVIKNYHQQYLKEAIEPVGFKMHAYSPHLYFSIKINPQNTKNLDQVIGLIRSNFEKCFPDYPFEYLFLDEFFGRQYAADRRFGKMAGVLSLLSIFIACIGMWAMSVYTVFTRTREIGIRKVFGATASRILIILAKDFINLIFLANIAALSIAYFVTKKWLENYAYRVEIGWWLFVIPILAILLSTLVTVSYQVFKVASSNPVNALRYE